MNRRLRRGALNTACFLSVLGGALALAAPAQADDCANAAFRGGPGAALSDCRAYEQISPVEKSGSDVLSTSPGLSFGDRVLFTSAGSINGSESLTFDTSYMATRGSDWTTKGTDAPLDASGFLQRGTFALSDDGTKAAVVSQRAYTAGAFEGGSNIYIRDLTQPQSYRLVVGRPSRSLSDNLTQLLATGGFAASNGDLSAVAFTSQDPLVSGVPNDGQYYLYLWHDGNLQLASQLPNGDPVPIDTSGLGGSPVNNTPSTEYHYLSDDGTRLLFKPSAATDPQRRAYYQYVEGQGSTLISRSQRNGDDPSVPLTSNAAIGSPDGRTVTFESSTTLTDGPGSGSVYRWSADAPAAAPLTRLDAPSVAMVSPDGRYVWSTRARSVNGVFLGTVSVLDTQTSTSRDYADLALEPSGPTELRFSPDGHRIAFVSQSPIGGVDNQNVACKGPGNINNGNCANVFTYDADTPAQPVRCVSCAPQSGIVGGAAFERGGTFVGGRLSRVVLDDGRVFFDTLDRVSPRDSNSVSDVYEVDPDGTVKLITTGSGSEASTFRDASPDGRDVLIATGERLVPQDSDELGDIYTARVGGGIASQQIAPPSQADGCSGEACRPDSAGSPVARPAPGSLAFTPLSIVEPRFTFSRPSARTLRAAGRSGRLTLPVRVNLAGRVTATLSGRLSGRRTSRAGSVAARASKPGTVRLTVRLSKQARAALRRKGTLKLRLTVRYSRSGRAASTVLTFTTSRAATSNRGGAR